MAMNANLTRQFPISLQSALANQAFEGFVPTFELTVEEAEDIDLRAHKRAESMWQEFCETGEVVPGPAYVKTPH